MEIVFELVLGTIFYFTGKPIVWLIFGGKVLIDSSEKRERSKGLWRTTFVRNGERYIETDAVVGIGAIFWILVAISLIAYFVLL